MFQKSNEFVDAGLTKTNRECLVQKRFLDVEAEAKFSDIMRSCET